MELVKNFITIIGTVVTVWGVINAALGGVHWGSAYKDDNGPGQQQGVKQIVGSLAIIAAGAAIVAYASTINI